jgi:hypothetical protein
MNKSRLQLLLLFDVIGMNVLRCSISASAFDRHHREALTQSVSLSGFDCGIAVIRQEFFPSLPKDRHQHFEVNLFRHSITKSARLQYLLLLKRHDVASKSLCHSSTTSIIPMVLSLSDFPD